MQPSAPQTARGHETPFSVQFSVFMPNRVGQFLELLESFRDREVQVVGISVLDATEWSVIRLVFSDANHAREILRRTEVSFTECEILLVELPTDDSLREMCEYLLRAEINVQFAFPLTIQNHENPVLAVGTDDRVLAAQVLTRHELILLGDEDLADPGT